MNNLLEVLSRSDVLALCAFLVIWLAFEIVVDHSPLRHRTLSGMMGHKRREWFLVLAERDLRMVDTAILTGLQQGAAWFGTVAILSIGGCLAAFSSSDVAVQVFRDLPIIEPVSRGVFELKIAGLTLIFVYSFFKFGWSYRLFNYCSILIGAVQHPKETDVQTRRRQALMAGEMNMIAGKHFTAGLRAIFMALAYLGWFAGPEVLVIMSVAVVCVLVRRQFFSRARRVLVREGAR